ncbi:MAG: trypsin-like peptidase domain-containing protein [Limisphaerales bacterium]
MNFTSWRNLLLTTGVITIFAAATPADSQAQPSSASPAPASDADVVANSIVKVFSTVALPDPYRPWSKQSPEEISGTGVVIDGNRILTCAHVVAYASEVQIQADQSADKVFATVEAVAPDMDLAVLKLDDPSFFDTHHPLPRMPAMPKIEDSVQVYGYPLGGSSLSITRGIISRIEFANYNYPAEGLRIQIDAAINPGNSGGPAVVNGKLIGIAFSRLTGSAENIGYIIPCEEIDLFLKQIADGHYTGKPVMMDSLQTLENSALRKWLKLDKSVSGMVVSEPYDSDPSYPLKQWDVITKIGGLPIDNQGMIKLSDDFRIRFKYEIQKIAENGKVPLTIVRNGRELQIQLPVPISPPLVIPFLQGRYRSFFIFGPVVFSESSQEFLDGLSRTASVGAIIAVLGLEGSPLIKRMGDKPSFPGERLVIISSPLFPHRLSEGYSDPMGDVVKTVNGAPVKNLADLVRLLRDARDEFITIDVDGRRGENLVFPRAEMLAATDEILNDNGIRSQGSADMMAVWNTKNADDHMASGR